MASHSLTVPEASRTSRAANVKVMQEQEIATHCDRLGHMTAVESVALRHCDRLGGTTAVESVALRH